MHTIWMVFGRPSSSTSDRQRNESKSPRPFAFGGFSNTFRAPLICGCHSSIGIRSVLPLHPFPFANRGKASSRTLRPQEEHFLCMGSPGARGTVNARINGLLLHVGDAMYVHATFSANFWIVDVSIRPEWSVCSPQRRNRKALTSSLQLSIGLTSILRPSWPWPNSTSSVGRLNQSESAAARL